jgi:hypothetical protein
VNSTFDDQPLSLNSVKNLNENPYLYPNPTQGIIRISGLNQSNNKSQIEVIDALGRQLLNTQLSNDNTFDVSFLNPGLYWIRLISETNSTVMPFVKVNE